MSFYLWEPAFDRTKDSFRKHYVDGKKIDQDYPAYLRVAGSFPATPEAVFEAVKQIRSKNLSVCLSQFAPPEDLEPLLSRYYKPEAFGKDKPLAKRLPNQDLVWRRTNETLVETEMECAVLDFDREHPEISCSSTLRDRMALIREMLPPLRDAEVVAFFSSSAWFHNPKKPNRINVHVIVFFDRPYPRETVRAFLKAYDCIDQSMAVKTQPHIVANPVFSNTPRAQLNGPTILHERGERLSLAAIQLPTAQKDSGKALEMPKGFSGDVKKKAAHIMKLAKDGELDGIRNELLYREVWKENFFSNGDTTEFLRLLDRPEIVGGKDIYEMDEGAKFHIHKLLTGKEFSGAWDYIKTVHHLDLADYDISELPTENAVIALKSGCGSGKTKGFIKRYIEMAGFESGLYNSVLKGTIEPAARDIGFSYYLEGSERDENGNEVANLQFLLSQPFLAITDKSLDKLVQKRTRRFDIVILDESERIALNSLDLESKQHELFEFCKAAKVVLLLDADLSDGLTGFFAEEIATNSQKELIKLINTADWMGEGHHFYPLKREEDTIGITEKLLSQNKRTYFHVGYSDTTEKKRISRLVRYFREKFPHKKIEGYDASSVPRELRANPKKYIDEKIEKEGLDLLIVSPWAKIGWDYLGENLFDATVGSYPHPFMSAPDIAQQMRRPRETKLHYAWVERPRGRPDKRIEKLEKSFQTLPSVQRLKARAEVASELLAEPEVEKEATFTLNSLFNTEMSEQARHAKHRQQINIPFHLLIILKERECVVHDLSTTDIKTEGLEELLTKHGEQAHFEDIKKHWDDRFRRETVVKKYYRAIDGLPEPLNPKACDFSQFVELYERGLKTKEHEIESLARLWNYTERERQAADFANTNHWAELAGRLLDEVDRIVCKYIGEPSRFLDWLADDSQEELHTLITAEDWGNLKTLFSDHGMRIGERIPWAKHLETDYLSFLEEMAEYFDLELLVFNSVGSKKDAKHEAIRHYMNIGLLKKSRAKTIPKINEKTAFIEAKIDEKLRGAERLSQAEEAYQAHRGHYLKILKHPLRSEKIKQALNSSR